MIGVIGGSGLSELEGFEFKGIKRVSTPFGNPSNAYRIGEFSNRKIVFLSRHGSLHQISPQKINYRANIWGLKKLGVKRILSVSAVGGINLSLKPGSIVIPDQIIDMTHGRDSTFYDSNKVVHIDFTEPYCPELRRSLIRAGIDSETGIEKSGTYVCVNGPRLETKAEIKYFSRIGADVVGMTTMPEASLAREAELCYAGIVIVTNYAAGIKRKKLTATEVVQMMKKASQVLMKFLKEAFKAIPPIERGCGCSYALKDAGM
jgi:5'-methylthioadenosine phosphorylase